MTIDVAVVNSVKVCASAKLPLGLPEKKHQPGFQRTDG